MILTERQSVFSHDHMTVLEKLQHQRRRRKKKKNAAEAPDMHENVHLGDYCLFSWSEIKNKTQAERIFQQNFKIFERKRSDDEKAPRNITTRRLLRRLTE